MGRAVIRGGIDAWVGAGAPNMEHPRSPYLRVGTSAHETFVYLRNPAPRGATVTSAKLRFTVRNSNGAARTISARRVDSKWVARRLNWNNRPGTMGVTSSATLPAGHGQGYVVELDVTTHVQTVASGDNHFGWKITTDSADTLTLYSLNAGESKPVLEVEWSDAPDAPTSLSPDEGATSSSHPTLQFDYTDVSGSTTLAAVRVQIDAAKSTVAPAFDSGAVSTEVPELDLTTTSYAGAVEGATTHWRVQVKDAAGQWSKWSEWATLTRISKPSVTIINPANITDPFVTEPTPTIVWSTTGTQTAWQVRITRQDSRGVVLYDSRKRQGTASEHTLPEGVLKDDRKYSVNVRVWDDEDREATPGDPVFSYAWRDFFMDDDLNTPGAATLTADVSADTPWVDLTWTRATMPDAFAVYRDDTVVKVLDPTDVFVSGTTYTWRDHTADPFRDHTWKIKAVVNGKQSRPGQSVTAASRPVGIWLIDLDRGITVALAGDNEGSWEMPDDASVHTPIGSDSVVRIVGGLRGYEGSLSGLLIDGFHKKSFEAQEDDLWSIKERPSQTVRLIAGDVNARVLIGNVTVAPRPVTRAGQIVKAVSFDFWQVGELPFEPRL